MTKETTDYQLHYYTEGNKVCKIVFHFTPLSDMEVSEIEGLYLQEPEGEFNGVPYSVEKKPTKDLKNFSVFDKFLKRSN